MQCQKINLDFNIDTEKLINIFQPYINRCIDITSLYPNDIIRVMTNYPSGAQHYTMNKKQHEAWDFFDNEEYTLCTMLTKYNSRMCSVYYKDKESIDDYVLELTEEIRKHENIKTSSMSMAIVYAGPKFRLEKHVDAKGLVRYHVPLITSENSYFETFEPYQTHYPKPGELWRLETHLLHTAQNDDKKNYRVHLIVDFL
jgi:hypothetical protein